MVKEGYEQVCIYSTMKSVSRLTLLVLSRSQFHESAFKIALFGQWIVVVSGPKIVDDLRKRSDDEVSFIEGVEEVCASASRR